MTGFTAAFPGSFDPFHYGHLDIVQKYLARHPSFELIIAIGVNDKKPGTLNLDARAEIIERMIPEKLHERISIRKTTGVIAREIRQLGVYTFVKGVRNTEDFAYEVRIARMNNMIAGIDTMFIPQTNQDYLYASSSDIKEMVQLGIDTKQYIPHFVEEILRGVL